MNQNNRFHLFLLFLAALLWGTTFVAQSIGADVVGPFTYLAGRSWIAVAFLTPVVHGMDRFFARRGIDNRRPRNTKERRYLIMAGCLSGFMLCSASAAQQIGIAYTTASKAGFITALYVVIVPLLSIVLGKRPSKQIWFCVLLALAGMYLLCMTRESLHLERGDIWELLCAFLFAAEILIVYHYSSRVDAVRLSRMQFLVMALLSTAVMLLTEHPTAGNLRAGLGAMLYAGVVSSGIAYTLQIFGQEGVNPSLASLVMSLESVFSALSGWLILGERLNLRELSGCVLMFASIILAQLDLKPLRHKDPSR